MGSHYLKAGAMEKVRVAYFTSFREIVGDEQVSRIVVDPDTIQDYGYRRGNLEDMALMLANPGQHAHPLAREFAEAFELAMVFSDDTPEAIQAAREAVHRWPLDVNVPNGAGMAPLEDLLVNIPSTPWRQVKEPLLKAMRKSEYELEIIAQLMKRGVDLIISDSHLSYLGPDLLSAFWLRALNIHPAITQKDNPDRLPGVTPTRDAYTRARYGFIIVDDKKDRDTMPLGTPTEVEYKGQPRLAIHVPKSNVTGVTVHVMTEKADWGPVVKYLVHHIPEGASFEAIREGNYGLKRQLLPAAMLEYARRPDVMELLTKKRLEAQIRGL